MDTVKAALAKAEAYTEEEDTVFSKLSDEALLMADEMLSKHYPLPEQISEQSIRDAHKRAKVLEKYAETKLFHQDEEFKGPGYLDVEVFGAGNGHSVEPLDANNVSWVNPLLPSLNLGPLAAGDLTANAFVFALGFSVVLIVIYIFKRMRILTDTLGKNGKVAYGNQNEK